MAEQNTRTRMWYWVGTAAVTLVATVGGSLLFKYFTEKKPQLIYEIVTQQTFAGQAQRVGIVAVRISNPGSMEIEDVQCTITLPHALILEARTDSLPAGVALDRLAPHQVSLALPFLNPRESCVISLLSKPDSLAQPSTLVSLRGRGIVGRLVAPAAGFDNQSQLSNMLLLLPAFLATIVATATTFLARRNLVRRLLPGPGDDQRDVIAYCLGRQGFLAEAAELRLAHREQRYWSQADQFTERALASNDPDMIRRYLQVLQELAAVGRIASESVAIILVNAARLAARLEDRPAVDALLKRALAADRKEAQARIDSFSELRRHQTK